MNTNDNSQPRSSSKAFRLQNRKSDPIITTEEVKRDSQLIRFEERKEKYLWARPDEIVFVQSADHYVKALISSDNRFKWMSKHCTIKDLMNLLPAGNFIRLNKFYLVNCNYFVRFNERDKMLFFNNDFSIPISHNISKYVLGLFKK